MGVIQIVPQRHSMSFLANYIVLPLMKFADWLLQEFGKFMGPREKP